MTAVIYARYSSDNQREESIEGQIRECTAYAEKNDITIVKHYIDRFQCGLIIRFLGYFGNKFGINHFSFRVNHYNRSEIIPTICIKSLIIQAYQCTIFKCDVGIGRMCLECAPTG